MHMNAQALRVLEVSLQHTEARMFYEAAPLPRPRPFDADSRRPGVPTAPLPRPRPDDEDSRWLAFDGATGPSRGVVAGETRDLLLGGRSPGLQPGEAEEAHVPGGAGAISKRPTWRRTSDCPETVPGALLVVPVFG